MHLEQFANEPFAILYHLDLRLIFEHNLTCKKKASFDKTKRHLTKRPDIFTQPTSQDLCKKCIGKIDFYLWHRYLSFYHHLSVFGSPCFLALTLHNQEIQWDFLNSHTDQTMLVLAIVDPSHP